MKSTFSVSMDRELLHMFDQACEAKNINRSALIRSLVLFWLKHQNDAPEVMTIKHDPDRD